MEELSALIGAGPDIISRGAEHFRFAERRHPLPGDLRLSWRIAATSLSLRLVCKGSKSSLRRLHLLDWGLRSPRARAIIVATLNGQRRREDVIIRMDPSVNTVLAFMRAEELIFHPRGDRAQLTPAGITYADAVVADQEALVVEKDFLRSLKGKITETWVDELLTIGGR